MGNETKYVCAKCFTKQEAKDIIERCGKIGNCDYCHNVDVDVMQVKEFVSALYASVYRKENKNRLDDKNNESYLSGPVRGFDQDKIWGEMLDMSVCDNMENNLKAATTNVNLQNDLINCWKKK